MKVRMVLFAIWFAPLVCGGRAICQNRQCKDTLAHLEPRLPKFANGQLTKLRQAILSTSIDEGAQDLRKRHIGPSTIAELVSEQARELDAQMADAVRCAEVLDTDPQYDDLERAFKNRAYDAPIRMMGGAPPMTLRQAVESSEPDGISTPCIRQFIMDDMVKIASAEIAIQLACRGVLR